VSRLIFCTSFKVKRSIRVEVTRPLCLAVEVSIYRGRGHVAVAAVQAVQLVSPEPAPMRCRRSKAVGLPFSQHGPSMFFSVPRICMLYEQAMEVYCSEIIIEFGYV